MTKEILATLTQRGQVTVPAEVRRVLGVKPRQKITFVIDRDQIRLLPAKFTLENAFGSVTPIRRPEDFETVAQEARAEKATRAIAHLNSE